MPAWKINNRALACLIAVWVAPASLMDARGQQPPPLRNAASTPEFNLESERKSVWENGIGEGVHWSCAGLSKPNLGLNGATGMLGLTFFF